jgi:hypothetical protein
MIRIYFKKIKGVKTATSKAKKNNSFFFGSSIAQTKKKNLLFYSKFQTQIPSSIPTSSNGFGPS